MKFRLSNILWLIFALLLLWGGWWVVQRARQPVQVSTIPVEAGPAEQLLAVVGRVRPREVINIKAENPGALVALPRDEGDRVSRGELLARVRSDQPKAAAAVSAAQIRAQEAQLRLARQTLGRQQKLMKDGWTTRARMDESEAAVAAATASLAALKAGAAQTQARQREFEVRAPMAGTILVRQVDPGQVVSVNDVLFQLGSAGPIEIEAEVDEYYADAVRLGAAARLMPSGGTVTVPGRVNELSPRVDASTGGRLVRLMPDIAEASLRPGRSVDVTISVAKRDKVISVPRTALVKSRGQWQVMLVEAGKVVPHDVEIEDWPGTAVIITAGLDAGDTLIMEPLTVKPGQKVRAVSPPARGPALKVQRPTGS
jgi:RND family efflux transporter MFP subunit